MQILYILTIIIFAVGIIISIIIMKITYSLELRLKKVSEKISDGYVILNKTLKITNYNKAFLKFIGLKEDEIKRKNIKIVLDKTNFKELDKNKIIESLNDIENTKNSKFLINVKTKTYEIEVMNLNDNDIFMRYVIIMKDVTKNYKAIEELKENQELIANREKFATLRRINNRNSTFFKITYFFINRRVGRIY